MADDKEQEPTLQSSGELQPTGRDISRRSVVVGVLGLVAAEAVAGGLTWQALSQGIHKIALALVPPVPTPTPTPNATATALQKKYTQATRGKPVLDDPLSDNSNGYGWNVGSGYCTFLGGALHAKRPSPGALDCDATGASSFSNFAFQVQMTIMSGDAGGIDFRINPANNYAGYYFSIGRDGSYRFYRSANFSLQQVGISGFSAAIHTGLGKTNLITVIAQNNTFDLYVNAQYIATVTDSAYSQGFVGVFAENISNSTEVAFKSAKLWTL
jgi:hypothetical protein